MVSVDRNPLSVGCAGSACFFGFLMSGFVWGNFCFLAFFSIFPELLLKSSDFVPECCFLCKKFRHEAVPVFDLCPDFRLLLLCRGFSGFGLCVVQDPAFFLSSFPNRVLLVCKYMFYPGLNLYWLYNLFPVGLLHCCIIIMLQ